MLQGGVSTGGAGVNNTVGITGPMNRDLIMLAGCSVVVAVGLGHSFWHVTCCTIDTAWMSLAPEISFKCGFSLGKGGSGAGSGYSWCQADTSNFAMLRKVKLSLGDKLAGENKLMTVSSDKP